LLFLSRRTRFRTKIFRRQDTLIDMRVMITGASGFLGSWLCRVLSGDHEIIGLVRKTSSLFKLSEINNLQIIGSETQFWPDLIHQYHPDVLILNHWWGVSSEKRNDPKQFENIKHLKPLILASRIAGVSTIIGVGSQAELGSVESEISERQISRPSTLYGSAKLESRLVIEELLRDSEARFVWMRIFSTYGPLDEGSWLIPNLVDSLMSNRQMKTTKGEQEWSYLHAYDLATAFNIAIINSKILGTVNVGNPETISIYKVCLTIGKMLEKQDLLDIGALEYRVDQVMKLRPLCETLTQNGWLPEISFDEGIRQTVDWLRRKSLSPLQTINGNSLDFTIPTRL
jgi:UDP-glucose 4-epimerase